MTPRDLGLPANDRHIHEAVAICARNMGQFAEAPGLRPRVVRLLQKRRHEDRDLMCLALLGGMPKMMDGILKERFDPHVVSMVEASRSLYYADYTDAAKASDTVKLYSLAFAAATVEGDTALVSNVSRYSRLAEETAGRTPDSGLERLFARKLEERREKNRKNLGLKPFDKLHLLQDDAVRKAYDVLSEYAADGRVTRQGLESAVNTARALSLMASTAKPATVAAALIDLSLLGIRYYRENLAIGKALGPGIGGMLKNNGTLRIRSPEDFAAAHEDFRPVAVAAFIVNASQRMREMKEILSVNPLRSKNPVVQRRLKHLQDAEATARRIILPATDSIPQDDLREMFGITLDKLTAFNARHGGPSSTPLLPPALPKAG